MHLIKFRGHKCESCGNTEWFNQPIKLEIHHIDGDRTNNNLENLQLLCPNCHSITPNWRKQKYINKNITI
jgi:5-methylcytosine-specific restriction endonuclease McrA